MLRRLLSVSLIALSSTVAAEPQKVDAFSFARAETDRYFASIVARNGGLADWSTRMLHQRAPKLWHFRSGLGAD